jgi:hypothetical protein
MLAGSVGRISTVRGISRRLRRHLGTVSGGLALIALVAALGAPQAHAEEFEQERQHALALGLKAYEYGQPLLDTERIYKTATSVTVPDHLGDAPVNQFSHFLELVSERRGVVAPNVDTLYSTAWLDLTAQPIVVHVPASSRFNVVEMLSPYTEDFSNIGSGAAGLLAPGDYVIAGPTQLVGQETSSGLKVIHSPYTRVWIIARTLAMSHEELANALAVQEATKLVPLTRWSSEGLAYQPPPPATLVTSPWPYTIPGAAGLFPLNYWAALGRALKQFPPPVADKPLLEQLAKLNIGPGLSPTTVSLGPGQVTGDIEAQLKAGFSAHNGWLVGNLGNYSTNYELRAITDRLGVGALTPNVSIYMAALTDSTGAELGGSVTRYVAHFPASDFPVPAQGAWSITMYKANGRFVANVLNRFRLGSSSNLHFNPDGSLDLYLQTTQPSSEAQRENWLPAPIGGFQMVMRLYGPSEKAIPSILAGGEGSWQPPTVQRCLLTGKTAAGWACAH